MRWLTRPRPLAVAGAFALGIGCRDGARASEDKAAASAHRLVPVVHGAVGGVRRGLPEAAKKLATLLEADPGDNLLMLQRVVATARVGNEFLERAPSTFFAFTDAAGIVVRSESDPDILATKSILVPFPALEGAFDPGRGVVEALGEVPELAAERGKADREWVAAHSVRGEGAAVRGLYATGWSLRRFAAHLQDTLKRDFGAAAKATGTESIPIVYVFVVLGPKVYGAPLTPDVSVEALEKLDLPTKTRAGAYRDRIRISDREFGVAAEPTPEWWPETAVAVLLSAI